MVLIFNFKCSLKCRLQFVSIWMSKTLSSGNRLKGEKFPIKILFSLTLFQWNSYRQLYQTKVDGDLVQKLEESPDGIMPIITKIEKEYGVKALYLRSKQMILISPAVEILELVHETLESRFLQDLKGDKSATKATSKAPVMAVLREDDEEVPDSGVDDDTFQDDDEEETARTTDTLPPLNNSQTRPKRTVKFAD